MTRLNKEQLEASLPCKGIHLVIAGAGTGKTSTMVERIKNVLGQGLGADQKILALTFSRKAAGEMKDRVARELPGQEHVVEAGTFHSFCLKVLQENRQWYLARMGWQRDPVILDDQASSDLLEGIIRDNLEQFMGLPVPIITRLLWSDAWLKRLERQGGEFSKLFLLANETRHRFRDKKQQKGLIDYSDMVNHCLQLLGENPANARELRERFPFIMVDEFQDSSKQNIELLKHIVSPDDPALFAVGDDYQSIYAFRGADPKYMIHMEHYFGPVTRHRLRINYRSSREIVKLSSGFIRLNRNQVHKRLKSFHGSGEKISFKKVRSLAEERDMVVSLVEQVPGEKTCAVLVRNNWQVSQYLSVLDGCPVECLTIHRSKGLEFDMVILAGIRDGILPDYSAPIEEERRLFYVGLTRAREKLVLMVHTDGRGSGGCFYRELRNRVKQVRNVIFI